VNFGDGRHSLEIIRALRILPLQISFELMVTVTEIAPKFDEALWAMVVDLLMI
jgi:hypothetical protein